MEPFCECGHYSSRHKSVLGPCKAPGCKCDRFKSSILNTSYSDTLSPTERKIMDTPMTRVTPSGTQITESDYQAIKKEASKETLKSSLALVGIVAIVGFVRNRLNVKSIPVPTLKD